MEAAGRSAARLDPEPKELRAFPCASICLAACALLAHCVALGGNIIVANSMNAMGGSTRGWAGLGIGFAQELQRGVGRRSEQVTQGLTEAIGAVAAVDSHMAEVQALAEEAGASQAGRQRVTRKLQKRLKVLVPALSQQLRAVHGSLRPSLLQVQTWLTSFGDRAQRGIESFSLGLDVAQKALDELTARLGAVGVNAEEMQYQTFSLFDMSKTGSISVQDLQDVAALYSISALVGRKAEDLVARYDGDGDGQLSRAEFARLTGDKSIPNVMAVVLRAYAKKLAIVAGQVGSARMRDEMSQAVANYLSLVCAKNLTKVGWVSQALTNGSLSLPMAADVLGQLAVDADAEGRATTADIGALVMTAMVENNATSTASAVRLISDAAFWESEGFDLDDHARAAKKVGGWFEEARRKHQVPAALLGRLFHGLRGVEELDVVNDVESLIQCNMQQVRRAAAAAAEAAEAAEAAAEAAEAAGGPEDEPVELLQSSMHKASQRLAAAAGPRRPPHRGWAASDEVEGPSFAAICEAEARSSLARHRRDRAARAAAWARGAAALAQLGSSEEDLEREAEAAAERADESPAETQAVSGGHPSRPVTLEWASWLAANASRTAAERLQMSFVYSGQSSGPIDSVATGFSKMVKRFQEFLAVLEEHASKRSVARLDAFIANTTSMLTNPNITGILTGQLQDRNGAVHAVLLRLLGELLKLWSRAQPIIAAVREKLPSAISVLKNVRKEVVSVSKTMDSVFTVMLDKAPPVFDVSAGTYRAIWITYFVVFALLTIGSMYFALYSSGVIGGGPPRPDGREVLGLRNPWERTCMCWRSWTACLGSCDDSRVFFWSMMLLAQVLWQLMFLVSFALLLITGVKAFVAAGCAPVYMLGDPSVLAEALGLITTWLGGGSDWVTRAVGGDTDSLLVCDIISVQFGKGVLMAGLANLAAAVLAFQMILDSAALFERRRCRKAFEAEG